MLNLVTKTIFHFLDGLFLFLDDTTEVSPIEASKDPDSNAISLADFDLIRVIGRGSYAKVLMVELKKTKRIYAMKVIKKELVTDDEVSTLLNREKQNYIALFWEVISEVRKITLYTSKRCPKKPHSLQSDISMFRVQH